MGTVSFPTKSVNNSSTLIGKIFIDNRGAYTIKPWINGLQEHDAQLITLETVPFPNRTPVFIYTRDINNNTTAEFQYLLSLELWDNVIGNNNTNDMFNNFHNTYLRCYASQKHVEDSIITIKTGSLME
jgi:hypothetical protein